MLNAMALLAPQHGDHRNILVGETIREPLTPAQSSWSLRVTTGEGVAAEPSLVPQADRLALAYGPVENPGGLTASIGSEIRVFAANVDPTESDLAAIDERAFRAALDREVRFISDPNTLTARPDAARSTELASLALYLVIGLLLVEMWMAMRFGSQRAADRGGPRHGRTRRAASESRFVLEAESVAQEQGI